jgi:hypothetical protein
MMKSPRRTRILSMRVRRKMRSMFSPLAFLSFSNLFLCRYDSNESGSGGENEEAKPKKDKNKDKNEGIRLLTIDRD